GSAGATLLPQRREGITAPDPFERVVLHPTQNQVARRTEVAARARAGLAARIDRQTRVQQTARPERTRYQRTYLQVAVTRALPHRRTESTARAHHGPARAPATAIAGIPTAR